jgi:NADPH2 dehydrogenase
MGMADPIPQFSYVIQQLRDLHPNLAYLHLIERAEADNTAASSANDPLRKIWGSRPLVSAVHTLETAIQTAEEKGDIIAFGKFFIANVSV